MPASLKDLRNRIKSVKNTQQITKAMKLVSAAKFGRAQQAVVRSRPYAQLLKNISAEIINAQQGTKNPLLHGSEIERVLVVIVSSERGLCGGFNTNIAKKALKVLEELHAQGKPFSVMCLGKKAFQLIGRRLNDMAGMGSSQITEQEFFVSPQEYIQSGQVFLVNTNIDKIGFEGAKRFSVALSKMITDKQIGQCLLIYNKFLSAMTQTPTAEIFLPLDHVEHTDSKKESIVSVQANKDIIFEPDVPQLLNAALPRYLTAKLNQIFLESSASEHGARMTAMDSATRNAKEMQRRLEITYQRARQAAITRELIEIISGAEAL